MPTLETVHPAVTRAGSAITCVGAVTAPAWRSAYGARAIVIGADASLSFSAFASCTAPAASVGTVSRQSPETSTGTVRRAAPR